jgi:hypothetical protein
VELEALLARFQERESREDYRAALVAFHVRDVWIDHKKTRQPPTIRDFLLHDWPLVHMANGQPARERVQSAEEQTQVLTSFFMGLGAKRV